MNDRYVVMNLEWSRSDCERQMNQMAEKGYRLHSIFRESAVYEREPTIEIVSTSLVGQSDIKPEMQREIKISDPVRKEEPPPERKKFTPPFKGRK